MSEPLDIIWTAGGIARFLRVGNDAVYALARDSDAPIYRACGRLYAFESELAAWMKRPQNKASPQSPTKP